MDIVFDGFDFGSNEDTFKEIFSDSIKNNFDDFNEVSEGLKIHIISSNKDFYIGNIISDKKNKSMTTEDVLNKKFSKYEFDKKKPPRDFNFFILHKRTLKGIYSSYKGSYSFGSFAYLINKRHVWLLRERTREIESKSIDKKEKQIQKTNLDKIYPKPGINLLASSESFIAKIERLVKIRLVSHSVSMSHEDEFSATNNFKKESRLLITIDQKLVASNKKGNKEIINYIKKITPKNIDNLIDYFLSVQGMDNLKKEWTYNYAKQFEKYAKISYDVAVDFIDDTHIYDCENRLIELIKDMYKKNLD